VVARRLREGPIAAEFCVSGIRHAQRLNRVTDDPPALEHDAQLVRRLQRVRASRLRSRSARTITQRVA
jgi:hypothetical protein